MIVADHCAGSAGRVDLPLERYHIPLWIYSPAHVAPRVVDELVSQIDIGPTILGLLNLDYASAAFGVDVHSPAHPQRALIANYQDLGYFDGRDLLILKPRRQLEQLRYEDGGVERMPADPAGSLADLARAYYQTAATTYREGLDAWQHVQHLDRPARPAPPTRATGSRPDVS